MVFKLHEMWALARFCVAVFVLAKDANRCMQGSGRMPSIAYISVPTLHSWYWCMSMSGSGFLPAFSSCSLESEGVNYWAVPSC